MAQVVNNINNAYQLDGLYRVITNTRWNINDEFMVPHLVNPKLAQAAQVQHLVLTHLGPPIQTSQAAKEAFIKGMSNYYSGSVHVANDRDQFELISTSTGCQFRYLS